MIKQISLSTCFFSQLIFAALVFAKKREISRKSLRNTNASFHIFSRSFRSLETLGASRVFHNTPRTREVKNLVFQVIALTDESRHLFLIILFFFSIFFHFINFAFVYVYLNLPFIFFSHEFLVTVEAPPQRSRSFFEENQS